MKNKKYFSIIFLSGILLSVGLFGQNAIEWIGSYSSEEIADPKKGKDTDKLYYYWQLESLKKGISPRYIRLLDAEKYPQTGKFLDRGILFTYEGIRTEEVEICGNFSAYRCLPMKKNKFGVFYRIIQPEFREKKRNPANKYLYKFKADGLFELDPENQNRTEEEDGSLLSEYILEKKDIENQATAIITENEIHDEPDFRIVEFRVYKPEATMVSLVGSFNHWNPELDYMKKDRDGIFTFQKKLKPGEYLYSYIVDGEKTLDLYNPETRIRFDTKEISSYLNVAERDKPYERP
ncbi:MAG: carbohydrate-binding module 48 [Leptospiraceae bacterium]|nr:carbohydrate-binding module 48 [Leptospiraceae bacterium]